MLVPEAIRRAWQTTDYRVRLPQGGYASIRFGSPLPPQLAALLPAPTAPWGYITAWNPDTKPTPVAVNRANQRRLVAALRSAHYALHAGVGVGDSTWREASLFVPGIDFARLDALARQFRQSAVLRGRGNGPAELHPTC